MRAVSSWSLHRTLGRYAAPESAATGGPFMSSSGQPGGLSLLELPAALATHGYDTLQIVHFHIPERTPTYLARLREALDADGITLDALLIDDGDLTGPDPDAAEAWIAGWLETAIALDARRARVAAGRANPTPDTLAASATRLTRLAQTHPGVRLVTENWWGLLPDADAVESLFGQTGDAVGLLIDLGNWSGPDKYDELTRIAPRAETCHAKCKFTEDGPDETDYRRSLEILRDANYSGPLALIYDGPDDDEWACLDTEHAIVTSIFAS